MLILDAIPQVTTFSTMSAWAWLVQFFIIATALLVANVIRVKFKFMSRSLIPTALIAGLHPAAETHTWIQQLHQQTIDGNYDLSRAGFGICSTGTEKQQD